jgi:toxin-antitoxin system PIN domain toxin
MSLFEPGFGPAESGGAHSGSGLIRWGFTSTSPTWQRRWSSSKGRSPLMLVDATILLFAVDESSRFHTPAIRWLTERLDGPRRVGVPWQSIGAFLRISTHPRASERPLSPDEAWSLVEDWLRASAVWIPQPTERHAEVLGSLITGYQLRGNRVSDAQLAALAIEHGLTVCSADTDFARFKEIRWENPLEA